LGDYFWDYKYTKNCFFLLYGKRFAIANYCYRNNWNSDNYSNQEKKKLAKPVSNFFL